MRIELDKELVQYTMLSMAAIANKESLQNFDKLRKQYLILLDPEHKDEAEKIFESAKQIFAPGKDVVVRVKTGDGQVNAAEANRLLNG